MEANDLSNAFLSSHVLPKEHCLCVVAKEVLSFLLVVVVVLVFIFLRLDLAMLPRMFLISESTWCCLLSSEITSMYTKPTLAMFYILKEFSNVHLRIYLRLIFSYSLHCAPVRKLPVSLS